LDLFFLTHYILQKNEALMATINYLTYIMSYQVTGYSAYKWALAYQNGGISDAYDASVVQK
jgi:hypothetical protein